MLTPIGYQNYQKIIKNKAECIKLFFKDTSINYSLKSVNSENKDIFESFQAERITCQQRKVKRLEWHQTAHAHSWN